MAGRYSAIIESIFERHYEPGATSFDFRRDEIETTADRLGIELPKNLGDVLYSFRFRQAFPEAILRTAPPGKTWIIRLAGRGAYSFALVDDSPIAPAVGKLVTKIPDATPEIISQHALDDEQALLAKVRYNRLIDIFLSVTAYSLQSHLRTAIQDVGQIEIDEVYLAVDRYGAQYIVPVQAKGGADRLAVVQAEQDIAWCRERFPHLTPRAIAAQFMEDEVIVLFDLTMQDGEIRVADERHYELVQADAISAEDLNLYRRNSGGPS